MDRVDTKTTICTWNSRGLTTSVPYIRELIQNFDVVLICEHWLHECRQNFVTEISDSLNYVIRSSKYSSSDNFGYKRGQGGVMILWDKSLTRISPINEIIHDRICGVRLQNENGAVFNIFNVYLPAQGSPDILSVAIDELSAILDNAETGAMNIIAGDFNSDLGLSGGPRAVRPCTREGLIIKNFIDKYKLFPFNLSTISTGPINTFYGPNSEACLDYIMIPIEMENMLISSKTLDFEELNTSDHLPVTASLNIRKVKCPTIDISYQKRINWKKISKECLKERFSNPVGILLDDICKRYEHLNPTNEILDRMLNEVVTAIKQAESNLPKSKYCSHLKPYWCKEVDHLKRLKVESYKKWCNAGRPMDETNILRAEMKFHKKEFSKKLRYLSKSYENEEIQHVITSSEVNKDSFWKLLKKSKSGPKTKVSAIRDKEKNVVHDIDKECTILE